MSFTDVGRADVTFTLLLVASFALGFFPSRTVIVAQVMERIDMFLVTKGYNFVYRQNCLVTEHLAKFST